MADTSFRGRYLWYDTVTTDVDSAVAFYTRVVGWGTQTWESGGTPYKMWTVGDRPIGGLMKIPPDATSRPHWLGYIGTPDVDATTSRAAALGAQVHVQPTDIPTVGKFSVMRDPMGASFAAFSPQNPMPAPEGGPQVGDISWNEITTTDVEKCFAFYSDLFGWVRKEAMDMGPQGVYLIYGTEKERLGGIYLAPKEQPGGPGFTFYVSVGDLDAAAGRVKANGGTITMGPMDVPGGSRIAMLVDPQGAGFALHWNKG